MIFFLLSSIIPSKWCQHVKIYNGLFILIFYIYNFHNCYALMDQVQVIARCMQWVNNVCTFQDIPPVSFQSLNVTDQKICKADVAVAVRQIDWASRDGGRGSVTSFTINNIELLPGPVYPSQAYGDANYPHCDDMFNIFPPYGNGIIGVDGRLSILTYKNIISMGQIPIGLEFTWEGPHDRIAVCSMSGVSYVGNAEINIYIETQENAACPGWNEIEKTACSGFGECKCADSDELPRTCHCLPGYGGEDCSDCGDSFFGENCQLQCQPCLNNGHCDSGMLGSGECMCKEGFDPETRCATCLPGYYGPMCKLCPNCNYPHGNCEDGLNGSGRCSCAVGFSAEKQCMECMDSFYGDFCEPCGPCHGGQCNHGIGGDGNCSCPEGFTVESRCLQCESGFFGDFCTPCRSCNGHGRCNDTLTGDGSCICEEGYTSDSRCSLCDRGWDFNPITLSCQCAPEHFGDTCLSCPICAPHGHCNSGKHGDGRCICDVGWSDSNNCVGCMDGYFGSTCILCRTCGQGRCDDGVNGTGRCNCHRGWSTSSDCFDCEQGYFGPTCQQCPINCGNGICSSGLNGTGNCICDTGWEINSNLPCTTCAEGYIGSTCQLCPGYNESLLSCNGHGTCIMDAVKDVAVCQCDARYSGDSCEMYDFPVLMVAILGSIALSTLGICMCTMRSLGRQPRHYRHSNINRGKNFSRSEYMEISDMADLEFFVSSDTRDWLIPFESLTLQYEVGNGTSGQVFRSLFHSGGGSSIVAVKRLYSPVTGQEYFQSFFRREVSILSRLHHPNVVRFYGVSYYNRVLYIVTDFCPKSLSHLIENPQSKGPFEESFFLRIISQVVSGMGFLHSRNVVHRDLKPANVLISETDDVNICDFGLSRLIDPEMTSMTAEVGTPSYMAPEMATMGGVQSYTKGDVYSFGILLYSTWSRSKPYGDQGMNPFQLMAAVVNGLRPVIPISCPPGLARLMRACWDASPDLRPTFPEISLQLKDQYLLSMTTDEFPPPTLEELGVTLGMLQPPTTGRDTIGASSPDSQTGSAPKIGASSNLNNPGTLGYGTMSSTAS